MPPENVLVESPRDCGHTDDAEC